MKLKYRNITVPYWIYDKKANYSYYIYNNQKYTDLNKLFKEFLGSYLIYHFKIKDEIKEVYNLSDVLAAILKNYSSFSIPNKYKEEYSSDELDYIKGLQNALKENKLKVLSPQLPLPNEPHSKQDIFSRQVYNKYKDVIVPKKVHFEEYNKDYYVVAGNYYETIYSAIDDVYNNSLYYQFGGTKKQNNRTHFHSHDFEELIRLVFAANNKFKIHVFQRQYYSNQELEFLNKLADKLKELDFHSVEYKPDKIEYEEYIYLKDHKKYFSLLIHNIKWYNYNRKYQAAVLKSHKTKKSEIK